MTGDDGSNLPNFFILGAAKAGTTTLFEMLKQHPQVYLPYEKEPMFFSQDERFRKGLGWYSRRYFRGSQNFKRRGEASPQYLYWAEKVIPRLHAIFEAKQVRFIVILREPVARAYSWYRNMLQDGEERLPFPEALAAEDDRLREHHDELEATGSMRFGYQRGGRYASQLRGVLDYFPRESLRVVLLEDLENSAAETMRGLCEFLGIDAGFAFRPARRNPAAEPRIRWLHRLLRRPSMGKSLAKTFLPAAARYRVRSAIRAANLKRLEPGSVPPEAVEFLKPRFATEIADLSGLIARDLVQWV